MYAREEGGETNPRRESVMVSKSVVRVSLLAALALHRSAIMADAGAARHTGAGIARRQAFHERQRAEREELELQGGGKYRAHIINILRVANLVSSYRQPLCSEKGPWAARV